MQIDERVLALLEPARADHERPAEPRLRYPVARYDRELWPVRVDQLRERLAPGPVQAFVRRLRANRNTFS